MNYSKIHHLENKYLTTYDLNDGFFCNNDFPGPIYQFDFPEQKRTIVATKNSLKNHHHIFETIPPFSVLLPRCTSDNLIMGHIKDNKMFGMKINAYMPWACGSIFNKYIAYPEKDIDELMNIFWQSTFPYYFNICSTNNDKFYLDLTPLT